MVSYIVWIYILLLYFAKGFCHTRVISCTMVTTARLSSSSSAEPSWSSSSRSWSRFLTKPLDNLNIDSTSQYEHFNMVRIVCHKKRIIHDYVTLLCSVTGYIAIYTSTTSSVTPCQSAVLQR